MRRWWRSDGLDYIPEPERETDKPFLMPIEDVFLDIGAGHGGDGTNRARDGEGRREEIEIVGIKETTKTTCTGVEMFRKLLGRGSRRGTTLGFCCEVRSGMRLSGVRCWRMPKLDHAAHEV